MFPGAVPKSVYIHSKSVMDVSYVPNCLRVKMKAIGDLTASEEVEEVAPDLKGEMETEQPNQLVRPAVVGQNGQNSSCSQNGVKRNTYPACITTMRFLCVCMMEVSNRFRCLGGRTGLGTLATLIVTLISCHLMGVASFRALPDYTTLLS